MIFEPFVREKDSYLLLESWKMLIPSVIAGFTTKKRGISQPPFSSLNLGLHVDDHLASVQSNRKKVAEDIGFFTSEWACSEQVHDNKITKVTEENKGKGVFSYQDGLKATDGLYTCESNILLTLCYADCVPLYFIAPNSRIVGIAHAGWKGTVKDIAGEMVRTLKNNENVSPKEIYVAIGPSIGECCYVVDYKVIKLVKNVLDQIDGCPYNEIRDGQYTLNLKQVNKQLLLKSGVPNEQIVVSNYCTSCNGELFFSHRRDKGKTGRMMSFIGLKED